jgi:membrane associated rhomboid family serine protease
MGRTAHEPASDFEVVVRWLAVLWAVFVIEIVVRTGTGVDLRLLLGVRPREPAGLVGILFAPLLHGGIEHLLANSIGLLLLGLISCGYGRRLTGIAVLHGMLLSGVLAWLIGPSGSVHIGASGIVFALIGFLIANGLFRRGCLPVIIALCTLVLYGAALVTMLPGCADGHRLPVSWEMHLGGFIGGLLASWSTRRMKAA